MTNWAIETQDLVKKFPRKEPAKETPEDSLELKGKKAKSRRTILPFFKRSPKSWFNAVDGVSLKIERGEIFGLLGPNGAGKTTIIRMLTTLLEPTSGTACVNGYDIQHEPHRVRQSLGVVLAGERSIYWKLSGRENLEYFAALYHIPPKIARQRVAELLEHMELTARADDLVEKYSSGMKQRIAISKALLSRPPIILLDEPTLGLDPQAARRVRELVLELKAEGHTILLTTHYMEEADQLSDRIGIIDQGKIIVLDTPETLKHSINQDDILHLEVSGWYAELSDTIQSLPGIKNLIARHSGSDSSYEITLHTANSRALLPNLVELLNHNGTRLVNMNIVKPSLEDVFIHHTGKALRD
jgi:ABC-2 type transport system ATP-binding protein